MIQDHQEFLSVKAFAQILWGLLVHRMEMDR